MELFLTCNLQSAFSSAPPAKQPVGYITDFAGLGLVAPLANDLAVFTPLPATGAYGPLKVTQNQANVVGVIENLEWGGHQNDVLVASCYMSQKNALLLKQSTLVNRSILALGFCVVSFDQVKQAWYEQFYPQEPVRISCVLNETNGQPSLTVAEALTTLSPGISLSSVIFEVAPAAMYGADFLVATSAIDKIISPWGTTVGVPPPLPNPISPPVEAPATPPLTSTTSGEVTNCPKRARGSPG